MTQNVRFGFGFMAGVAIIVGLACPTLHAASGSWTGAGSAVWANDANWSATPYPSGADTATFSGAGNGRTAIDLEGLPSIKTVVIDSAGAAPYTLGLGGLNGQTLVLESSGLVAVTNGVVNAQRVEASVQLGTTTAAGTYTAMNSCIGSALTLAGKVAGAASGGTAGIKTLVVAGAGDTVLSGNLSNGGASRFDLTMTSTGVLTLSGTNTFTGNVAINSTGTLSVARFGNKFATDSNLGAGTNVAFGATASLAKLRYTGSGETSDRTFSLTGSSGVTVLFEQAGTGPLVLTGNILTTGAANKTVRLMGDAAPAEFAGALSDYGTSRSNSLAKYGTGIWTLSGANLFKGAVTISDGILRLKTGGTLGAGPKTLTITGAASAPLRYPSLQLAGAGGAINIPSEITLRTSNEHTGALINESGTNTIAGRIELTSGDNDTHVWSNSGKLILGGVITSTTTSRELYLRGDGDGEVSGVIENGSTVNLPVYKDVGSGTWAFTGSNTYSGATVVGCGALAFSGLNGSINGSSGITVTNGAVLRLDNRADANNFDRLKDTAAVALINGSLIFTNSGGAASYSETAGALSISGSGNTIAVSQAGEGQASALTFASLTRVGSATLSVTGEGIGESVRNRIFITGQADGTVFTWISVNGSPVSGYDSVRGLYAIAVPDADIAAYGDTLVSNDVSNVRINSEGTVGPIALSEAVTVIRSLAQNTGFDATVDTAGKTLRAETFLVNEGKAGLTIGVAPNDGVVAAPAAGGGLAFYNFSSNALTVNASVADNGASSALVKMGAGDLVLAGTNTLSGSVSVANGSLILSGTPALPGAVGQSLKLGGGTSATRVSYLGGGETIGRAIDLAGTTAGTTLEQSGSGLLRFAGDLSYSGLGNKTLALDGSTDGIGELAGVFANGPGYTNKLSKSGSGTWILSNANAYSGDTEINNGTLVLKNPQALGTSRVVFYSRVPNGVLELAHDGAGEIPFNITIGLGYNGTLLSGVASGDTGISHAVGDLSLSGTTLTVARASGVLNGSPSISARSVNLSGGGAHTSQLNPTTADFIIGSVSMLTSPFSKTLRLDGTSSGNCITGVIDNGIHTISVQKSNSSTWTLTGANTYTGTTSVTGGTLALGGALGAISASRSIALSGNGALALQNSPAANSADRLGNALPISLSSGTLSFSHSGGATDYSEAAGVLTVSSGSNTVAAAQADVGQTSALTFGSLARTGGTVDFAGSGLGADARNQILFSTPPTLSGGLIGPWATVNGASLATYGTFGVAAYAGFTDLSAKGPSTLPDDANANARINSEGTGGGIDLAGTLTNRINTLSQNTDYPATVTTAAKTLLASGLLIGADRGALTLGAAAGDGTLSALTAGGELDLVNQSANPLTVNAALADNAAPSSLAKIGNGPVTVNGACAYTGPTAIQTGSLTFGGHAYPQVLAGVISGDGTLVKSGTNLLHLLAANTYSGPTLISQGIVRVNENAALGTSAAGTFIADGATLDLGCTPDVGGTRGANTLNMGAEPVTVQGAGVGGLGAIVNNSAGQQYYALGKVTLAGDATFSTLSRWDLRSGTLNMNDHCLTKVGADVLAFSYEEVVPGNAGTAQFDVKEGSVRLQVSSKLNGSSANTLRLRSGASLELYRLDNAQSWSLVCESNSIINAAFDSTTPSQNRWAGPVALVSGPVTLTGGSGFVADLQGEVTGSGSLVKAGSANITLSGTNNTYTGETRIQGGRLIVTSLRNIGEACSLGRPSEEDAAIKIGLTTTSYALEYTGAGDTSDRPIDMAGTSGGVSLYHSGTGPLKLTANLAVSGTGSKTLTVRGNSTSPAEFAGAIANVGGNAIAVTKADAGDWLLSGNNSYSGTTAKQGSGALTFSGTNACSGAINVYDGTLAYTGSNTCSGVVTVYDGMLQIAGANAFTGEQRVNGGTLVISGANAQGSGSIKLGYNSGSNGVMRVQPGASITGTGYLQIGNGTGSAGALYMTGGTLARTPGDHQSNFIAGDGQNSFGYFNVSGGTLSNARFQLGGTQDPRTGIGIGRVTGGTLAFSSWMLIGRQTNSVGVLTLDGGTINHVNASYNVALAYGGGRGELNITGGTLNSPGRSVSTGQYNLYGATGIVNLCAGTLAANTITNIPGVGMAVVNFSGGTLKACVNAPQFMTKDLTYVNVNGPFGSYAGGAVIDSDSKNVTISAPLLAPTGNGVRTIALATKGSGYIGEPYVSIAGGGGFGATAVANMEEDGSGTYRVASVTVTSPGWDYASEPAVAFLMGGNGAVAPTVSAVTLAANTSGGLTKLGAGTLTLSATNSYAGPTTVSGGTLKLGSACALPANSSVVLSGGTLDLGGFTCTNSLTALGGAVTNGTLQTVLSPAGEGVVGSQAVTLSGAVLTGTYLADVATSGDSDLVAVTGSIDLSGLTLQLVEPGLLDRHKQYTLLTCAGTLTGNLTAANLPDSRWHVRAFADGTVKLMFVDGTLIQMR